MSGYRLHWTERAEEDFLHIIEYVAERNPGAARRLEAIIQHAADRLVDFPLLHRNGRRRGTREAVLTPNYIMVYRVDQKEISILALLHARQRYP